MDNKIKIDNKINSEGKDHNSNKVLCGERVSQMTRAYHDIEAVTRLLEEKERDLELAARIGQGLLEKNDHLANRIELLEEQYVEATEKISQLRFEVSMKDSLLTVYDENYEADICVKDGKFNSLDNSLQTMEALQKKVKTLERENETLKEHTSELQTSTFDLEAKEEKLVDDCVRHLNETNRSIQRLEADLTNKSDVCVNQQEDITNLMSKAIAYEGRLKKAHSENNELQKHLSASQEAQKQLTSEIAELEDKYEECSVLLRETQEELKSVRKRSKPSVIHQHYGTSSFFMPQGSLAAELEKSETPVPEGYTASERSKHMKGVFKTAKYCRRSKKSDLHSSQSSLSTYSNLSESQLSDLNSESNYSDDDESMRSIAGSNPRPSDLDSTMSDSLSQTEDSGMFGTPSMGKLPLGKPGIPGSNDLETALRRLAVQRANDVNSNVVQEGEELDNSDSRRGLKTPTPCNTPDSFRSSSSHVTGRSSSVPGGYRGFPEKLQIVKPLEGSTTLHHWQRLAQPRIEGIFEQRPGVHNRGEKSADLAEEIYSLSDYEEDGTCDSVPTSPAVTHTHARCLTSGFCLCSISGDEFSDGEGERKESSLVNRNIRKNNRNNELSTNTNNYTFSKLSGRFTASTPKQQPEEATPEERPTSPQQSFPGGRIQNGRRIIKCTTINEKKGKSTGFVGTNGMSRQVARKVMGVGVGEAVVRSGSGGFLLGIRKSLGLVVIKCEGTPNIQQLQSTGYLHMVGKPVSVDKDEFTGFNTHYGRKSANFKNNNYSSSV